MQPDPNERAPEKPPTKTTGGSCCSKIATFLGLAPRVVAWLSIGSLRFELGVTLARAPSRSTEPT
jgi:hypothetical protein